jgi:hypothetical protein
MTLIKLINIIESLKKNSQSLKKWAEISELVQDNYSDSVYTSIVNLIKRDSINSSVLDSVSQMILKFPRHHQMDIVSHLKQIDHPSVVKVFHKLPIEVLYQDYGILEYYFVSETINDNPIAHLTLHFQKDQTLMEKSCHVWILLGMLFT